MAKGRRYKSAYRLTTRRKAALRKAQLISARKRKGRGANAVKVGILATGIAVGVLGTKYGPSAANMAKDLKNRKLGFNNPANAAKMTPDGLEANMRENAVSPPSAARQADPIKPPKAGGSTPKPNNNTFKNWGDLAASAPGNPATVVPSQGAVVDPFGEARAAAARDPNQRKIHPMAADMTKERIAEGLRKAGVNPAEATWREIAVLAEVQAEYLNRTKNAGFRVYGPGRGNRPYTQFYRSILDIMEIPSAGDLNKASKKA